MLVESLSGAKTVPKASYQRFALAYILAWFRRSRVAESWVLNFNGIGTTSSSDSANKLLEGRVELQTNSICQRYRLPVDNCGLDSESESTMMPGELFKPWSLISLTSLKVPFVKSCSYSLNSIAHEPASRTNQAKVGRVETVCPRRRLGASKISAGTLECDGTVLIPHPLLPVDLPLGGMESSSSLPSANTTTGINSNKLNTIPDIRLVNDRLFTSPGTRPLMAVKKNAKIALSLLKFCSLDCFGSNYT